MKLLFKKKIKMGSAKISALEIISYCRFGVKMLNAWNTQGGGWSIE